MQLLIIENSFFYKQDIFLNFHFISLLLSVIEYTLPQKLNIIQLIIK